MTVAILCRFGLLQRGRYAAKIPTKGVLESMRMVIHRKELPFPLWKIVDTSMRA